jgi:hypothetical protein
LYQIEQDPYELKNLISDPALAQIKEKLLENLKKWMADQNDFGIQTESKALTRFKGDTLHWKGATE